MGICCAFCKGSNDTGFDLPEIYKEPNRCCICGRTVYDVNQIKIVGPFILVEPATPEITTRGIIFPATMWRIWRVGKVIKLGEREKYTCFRYSRTGKRLGKLRTFVRPDINIGDIVLFQKQAPRGYDLGQGRVYFLHYEDVELKAETVNTILPM